MQVSKLVCISALVYILMMCATFTLGAKSKYDENDVFVHNMQLYVGSKQFFVKGISYSPEPLGRPKEGGFCSKKVNYQGVMYGACINEYYFDGVNSNNAYNAKPNGPWFNDIWERDLPVIKELGANTVRVYHMDYITQALIQKYPEYRQKYIQDYAATHKPFMDAAEKHGLKVIVPIVAEEAVLTSFTEAELKKFVEGRVDEIGNHPALLMWAVGNELGLYQKADLRKTVNIMMDYIREYTITKWNRAIPVTTTEVDLPESFNLLSTDLKVDIFAFNAGYRDIYMNTLWQPDTTNKFVGWKSIAQSTGKPLIVSEFGSHNADQLASSGRPDWPNQQYKTIVSAMDSGCVGGIFYEYSDETTAGTSRGLVTFTKATDAETGKDSTQAGVFLADNVNRKDLFDILKSGKSGSAFSSYCYTADEWQLAGAARNVLNLDEISPSDPPANPPTPGNSDVDNQPDDGTSASSSPFSFAMYILIVIASFAILGYTRM